MAALGILAVITFLLHLAWESAHLSLYRDYGSLEGKLPVPVWAAIGDVAYTFIAVGGIAFLERIFPWFVPSIGMVYLLLALLGFLTALFVEYKAFYLKRWTYAESMPVLPFLNVGLSSVVQKTALFPLSVWVTNLVLTGLS